MTNGDFEIQSNGEPSASPQNRDLVTSRLDHFCNGHGDRLGRFLWERSLSDFALIISELVDGDVAVWMAEKGRLIPVFNGPKAERLERGYTAAINGGLLGQAFTYEQSFGGSSSAGSDDFILDAEMERRLGIRIVSLLATPLYFGAAARGVVSATRFVETAVSPARTPPPFDENETLRFEILVGAIGRLLDERIFSKCFGIR